MLAERSVNWTVEETQVLLCAWSDERVQKSLAENLRNRHVFKHLSARMSEMGFSRSPHQCRLRVKTLKANYVRAKLQRSVDSLQPCTFKYFSEMDAVLGRRSLLTSLAREHGCRCGSRCTHTKEWWSSVEWYSGSGGTIEQH
uniref:Myb/SANT-like DNA-binding domain-containing protein n=1 Tax=Monopterus albus TaxID=43700 RepID=A0A3Q3IW45_MONAL